MKSTHKYNLAALGTIFALTSIVQTNNAIAGELKPQRLAQADPAGTYPPGQWYGGVGVGFSSPNISSSTPVNILGVQGKIDTNVNSDSSIGFNGFVGYKTGGSLRGEAEVFYNSSNIKGATGTLSGLGITAGSASVPASGNISNLAVMINGYYDFNNDSKFTPFVGVGVGYGSTTANANGNITLGGATIPVISNNSSSSGFAYQLKAGASYAITDRNDLYLQYRYLNTGGNLNGSTNSFEIGTRLNF
jgi:opacity protein-like surface antigen